MGAEVHGPTNLGLSARPLLCLLRGWRPAALPLGTGGLGHHHWLRLDHHPCALRLQAAEAHQKEMARVERLQAADPVQHLEFTSYDFFIMKWNRSVNKISEDLRQECSTGLLRDERDVLVRQPGGRQVFSERSPMQVQVQRQSEAEFRADTQAFLAKARP